MPAGGPAMDAVGGGGLPGPGSPRVGGVSRDEENAAAAVLLGLLETAARDGHTVVPLTVVRAALAGRGVECDDALEGARADVAVFAGTRLGLRRLLDAEDRIARAVATRMAGGRIALVAGPAGERRDDLVTQVGGDGAAVADDAQSLDVEAFAAFFESCGTDEMVVLAGDPDELGSPGPGDVFASLLAVDGIPRYDVPDDGAGALAQLLAGIRRGELPRIEDPDRQVVVVPVANAAEAVHRVSQLLATSIPRAFGIPPAEIQVLCPLRRGPGGVLALRDAVATVGAPAPRTIHEAVGYRWPAVVVVFSPECAGVLTRQLVYTALSRAERHVSIVHGVGTALAGAVRSIATRPRRTTLRERLTQLTADQRLTQLTADG
ncbi:ATP-binding domain-containing protein [Acidothermus cellulolyticus]|uniref:ATP-binding domain-containing protein n=1 Tax=Acidothermus cellulolyticus TaxID=28049 RepID=UPI00006BF0EC|nr:ATP-binding domain-containing protein [Acidothermus cellulolyticus]